MKDWKVKQEIYHRLTEEYTDDLNKVEIVHGDTVDDIVKHFYEKVDQWVYPAKSYFVAICYAHWLAVDYEEDFMEYLNDPDLLYGNDPYFKTYSQDSATYDEVFKHITFPIAMEGMVPDVRNYYEAECGPE